jgi:hypothetical protein
MIIEIRSVKRCKDGSFGYFQAVSRTRALICVSQELNTTVAQYAATLLHELLHLWVTLLRADGFKARNGEEHRFIYDVETMAVRKMKKHFKRAA